MWLRIKSFSIKNSDKLRNAGLKLLGIYTCYMAFVISLHFDWLQLDRYIQLILWISSFVLICTVMCLQWFSQMQFNELDKIKLTYQLQTEWSECNDLIDSIILNIRNQCKRTDRMILDFTHKGINIGHVDLNTYNIPYISVNSDELGYNSKAFRDSIVYHMKIDPDHFLYLKEFLYSNTKSRNDFYELEKTYFKYCT